MLILPAMHGNDPMTTRFPADGQAVSIALAAARRFAGTAGLAPGDADRLAIIIEELVINIVEHGDAAGAPITLRIAIAGPAIHLALADEGRFFDPRLAEQSETIPERGGGVGLALVRAWTRIIGYSCENGCNRLELIVPLRNDDPPR